MKPSRVTKLMFFVAVFCCLAAYLEAQGVEYVPTAIILISPESDLRHLTPQNLLVSVGKSEFIPVKEIKEANSAPLDVILLIDTSNSIRDGNRVQDALSQATQLIDSVSKSELPVRYAAIRAGETPEIVHEFTSEPISNRSLHLSSGGGTALFDAFVLAGEMFQKEPASNRHVVIAFTDGGDNASQHGRDQAIQALGLGSAMVYAVNTRVTRPQDSFYIRGEKSLERIAEMTGGRAFFPTREQQVVDVFEFIRVDLQQQLFVTCSLPSSTSALLPIKFKSKTKGFRFRAPKYVPSQP